jgi:methionyl-tRNA formyltransferase
MKKTLLFYAMTRKGYVVLEDHIREFGTEHMAGVITARDSALDNDHYQEIQSLCKRHGIPCYDRAENKAVTAAYAFAISWRWMISGHSRLVVFHDSLLPKYRGFAPLVNMLINGEKKLGVTALFAGKDYDSGDIIAQKSAGIRYPVTIAEAIEKLIPLYCQLATALSKQVLSGKPLRGKKQDEKKASYSLWRDGTDYRIDWRKNAGQIRRHVDASGTPYEGASCQLEGRTVRIHSVEEVNDVKIENREPGKVIFLKEGRPVVVCGKGLLMITSATDDKNRSLLPLKKFRTRFT